MGNALEEYNAGRLQVAGGVSHSGEPTLGLCIKSLHQMQGNLVGMKLASGLRPMCASFNACLDFAVDMKADILFHTASDVIVDPRALQALLAEMDLEENYLTVARGYDPMFGEGTSVGIWIWNMRIMKANYRFRDVFKQDLDLCARVEAATGKTRTYTSKDVQLGYHHPIWTPFEVYAKFVYSYPKYGQRRQQDMRNFLSDGLERNPANKALQAGQIGLDRAIKDGIQESSKNLTSINDQFVADTSSLHLDGTDYYCLHSQFVPYAMRVLGSFKHCHAI